MKPRYRTARRLAGLVSVALALAAIASASQASAAAPAWWRVTLAPTPAPLPPGGEGRIDIGVSDVGDVGVTGQSRPIVVKVKLPPGVTASELSASFGLFNEREAEGATCEAASLTCSFSGAYLQFEHLEVSVKVTVASNVVGEAPVEAAVTGGQPVGSSEEVPRVGARHLVSVSREPAPFGVERYELIPENVGGNVDAEAGTHPFQLTASLALNQTTVLDEAHNGAKQGRPVPESVALAKDLSFELPPGLVGNVNQTPQCTDQEFSRRLEGANYCPADTAVGVAQLSFSSALLANRVEEPVTVAVPLFNLTPSPGEPARFGFEYENRPVFLDTAVRTGGDYGITVTVSNILQQVGFIGSEVTF